MRIDVLGPVEASVAGRPAALGGARPRSLLAVLALTPGRVVSRERLIDELWGDAPPARARESLQMHVSRLRKALGGDAARLAARAGGYVLELDPGAPDLDRWEAAVARARRAPPPRAPAAAPAAGAGRRGGGGARGGAAGGGVGGDGGGAGLGAGPAARRRRRPRPARRRARPPGGGAPGRDRRGHRARARARPARRAAGAARIAR